MRILSRATGGVPSLLSHRTHRRQAARWTDPGGLTQLDNLALACWHCNLKKGPNLTGIDPETGQIAALFHPRKDKWADHFTMGEGKLLPLGIECPRVDAGWTRDSSRTWPE